MAELLTRDDVLLACRIQKLRDRAAEPSLTSAERATAAAAAARYAERYRYGDRLVYGLPVVWAQFGGPRGS